MAKVKNSSTNTFPAKATSPPNLSDQEWFFISLLGALFIIVALLQLLSFNEFKDALTVLGISSAATWGAVIVIAELWGAAALFKWPLSPAFRIVSGLFAVLASGFWFYESIRLVSAGSTGITNSGLLGRFVTQAPGWWTVTETTIVLFWTLWAVSRTQSNS